MKGDERGRVSRAGLGVVGLLVLYLVSAGPVAFLGTQFDWSEAVWERVRAVYLPHLWVMDRVPWYEDYINWWDGLGNVEFRM